MEFVPSDCWLVVALLSSLLLVQEVQTFPPTPSCCLRSCVRCKQMFGQYFLGHLCTDTCLTKQTNFKVVCTDIKSVRPFLDISSLMDYDYYDEEK